LARAVCGIVDWRTKQRERLGDLMNRRYQVALLAAMVVGLLLLLAGCGESHDYDSAKGATLSYITWMYGTDVHPIVSGITYSSDRTSVEAGVFFSSNGCMSPVDRGTHTLTPSWRAGLVLLEPAVE
jgi:hypothetical protein